MKKKGRIIKITLFITILFAMLVGVSFSLVNWSMIGTKRQVIKAGSLMLVLEEDENNLSIQGALPMHDEVAMIQEEAFTFRLINRSEDIYKYKIKLVEVGEGTLDKSDVKYGLTKDGYDDIDLLSNLDEEGVIDSGMIAASPATIEYELRLWLNMDEDVHNSVINGKSLNYKLEVEAETYDGCFVYDNQPNRPVLTSGMIAVSYDEANKTWVKADSYRNNWYDYEEQMWANAVTVTEETREKYMNSVPGEPINMEDINGMWVWIPRYSYSIKGNFGRGDEAPCTSVYASVEEAGASYDMVCIIPSVPYTEELKKALLLQMQVQVLTADSAQVTYEQIKDWDSILHYFKYETPYGGLMTLKTADDYIDTMFLSSATEPVSMPFLSEEGFFNNSEVRAEIVSIYSAQGFGNTEEELVLYFKNLYGFDTFDQVMALAVYNEEFTPTEEHQSVFTAQAMLNSEEYALATAKIISDEDGEYIAVALPGAIDIKFITTDVKDTGTGTCVDCAENWVTPEGFTFGGEELSGYWVGKFETTGHIEGIGEFEGTGSCYSEDCFHVALDVVPNKRGITGYSVASYFLAARSTQNSINAPRYGFDLAGTSTMDVHMMKNTEWGIVAYLSQSRYGKFGNANYSGANKEIYQNRSELHLTGHSSGTRSKKVTDEASEIDVPYDTPDSGYGASTTGTIYGVYDMSGSNAEFVMANYNNISGSSESHSGFCGNLTDADPLTTNCVAWPEAKYYDLYTSNVLPDAYKFGDATYEVAKWGAALGFEIDTPAIETLLWYSDQLTFFDFDSNSLNDYKDKNIHHSWFLRDGGVALTQRVGIFTGANFRGNGDPDGAFRITIKP